MNIRPGRGAVFGMALAMASLVSATSAQSQWRVEPFLQIGDATGDPDYEFGSIVGVVVKHDTVFVLDSQASTIRVFTPDGEFVRSMSRKGSGPGEMAQPVAMLDGPGDTLLVADAGAGRFTVFLTDGTAHGGFPLMGLGGIPIRWQAIGDGKIAAQIRPMGSAGRPAVGGGNDMIISVAMDGAVRDTLHEMESGKTIQISENSARFNFFSAEPVWAISENGLWFGVNDSYRISRIGPDGSEQAVASRPFTPQPVTDTDQNVLTDAFADLMVDNGAPPQAIQQLISSGGIGFADNFPAYLQFLSGPEGSLWVQHILRPSELSEEERETYNPQTQLGSNVWDVFSSSGQFQGTVRMPERFQPLIFQDDAAYGIWRDEYDVQYVLGVRIQH